MASWQADFDVALSSAGLPTDYRRRLADVLPAGVGWAGGPETWGVEDGDRVDVDASGSPPEVFARFDMREWRPDLYERFLAFVRDIGGALTVAGTGAPVSVTYDDFTRALQESEAARFVRNPESYFRGMRTDRTSMPEEP